MFAQIAETAQIPESQARQVRWLIVMAWFLMIASLLSNPATLQWQSSAACVPFQDHCRLEPPSYNAAIRIFWGMVIPIAIGFVFIFGHVAWRRICPLYFLSQIPRALGLNRGWSIGETSWLQRNHLYVQFGLLFLGLCARILVINADRVLLGLFILMTIGAAMGAVYLFGGRSWCHYFCPFGVVQLALTGPRGLLDPVAIDTGNGITQSMCRTIAPDGQEQSACVGCTSPCFDIDSELTYWESIEQQPGRRWVQYGYLGLVLGYFLYYGLYAGSFDYYFSGIWSREADPLSHLWDAGFYRAGSAIGIPKWLAVPLTLGAFSWFGSFLGHQFERWYRGRVQSNDAISAKLLATHHTFTISTFLAFNCFFIYGGKPELLMLPLWIQTLVQSLIVFSSTFWLLRTWRSRPQPLALQPLVLDRTVLRQPVADRTAKTVLRR
jgi:4Fe-4S binding domain